MTRRRTAKKFNLGLDIDERTNSMSDRALYCRTWGHAWKNRAISRTQVLANLRQGMMEYNRYCDNGCGSTWRQVWSIHERMIVVNDRQYPKNGEYLMPKGQGRLRRGDAWAANLQREIAEFV